MEGLIRFRHNVMNVQTISTFENIKGGINNNCKDVYFARAVGTNASYEKDIQELDEALLGRMNEGKGYYHRLNGLPKLQRTEDTTFYSGCYSGWLDSQKKEVITRTTEKSKALSGMLANACAVVEGVYMQGNKQITDSMAKNFVVKLLFWYDSLFADEKFCWDEKKSIKIVAANIEKKQEYLFFYLVTLMGCDVLLLQSRGDIGIEEEKLGLSTKFVLGGYSETAIPEFQWHATQAPQKQNTVQEAAVRSQDSSRIVVQIPRRERTASQPQGQAAAPTRTTPQPGRTTPARTTPQSETTTPARTTPQSETTAPMRATPQPRTVNTTVAGGSVSEEKSFEELAQLAASVVLIEIHDDKGQRIGSGSGIMIGRDGYILTNNHVACGGKFYTVRIEEDEQEYRTDEVIKYNSVLDLAIIRIQRKLNPIPVYKGKKPLVRGQKVVAIGSPLGLFNSVSDGIISGFRQIDNVDMIQFTAPTSRGSSGGAVLNMQGEVIGISTAGIDSGQNINLAMGYECINMFIKGFT